ncbi:hypothetical protein [Flavobacterium sp. XGLA_31]|uniref:hypothetical protein n=1 Tax=Flavobacterium sp. XGLA_31 TaxID=3447666 RepID=UPI003F3B05C7
MKKIKRGIGLFLAALTMVSCNPNDGTSGLNTNNDTAFAQNFGNTANRDFIGQIVDKDNNPIQGATVTIGSTTAQTDVNGVFMINHALVHEKFAYVTATKIGYLDGSRSLIPTTGRNNVKIMLLSNAPTATVASDAASEVALENGTKVAFDGAFQDESGAAYTGTVSVTLFHLLPSNSNLDALMPGMLYAQTATNEQAVLQTFGMINVELRGEAGQKLNLAEGHTAEITMKIDDTQLATAPTSIPLWHFDAAKGYWKEDGVATKVGNNYIGEVSHFSWWNCDAPFPTVTLTSTVTDANGHPLVNVHVGLLADGFSYTTYGVTNVNGQVVGLVPSNQSMTLTVLDSCGNVIYTSTVGPFTANTILPAIVIPTSTVQTTTVTGTLNKCDNTPVTNGYVALHYGTNTSFSAVTNGAFSINTLVCSTNNAFLLEGVDYDNLQSTNQINYTFTTPNTTIGILTACNTVSEFISYQIDSNTPVVFLNNLEGIVEGGNFSVYGEVNSTQNITIGGNSILPGFYTQNDFYIGNSGSNSILGNNSNNINIQFNLSTVGNIGEYIDMTFNGTYQDSNNVTHTLTGTVHVLRDN